MRTFNGIAGILFPDKSQFCLVPWLFERNSQSLPILTSSLLIAQNKILNRGKISSGTIQLQFDDFNIIDCLQVIEFRLIQ